MANFSDIANHSRASTATYVDSDGVLQTAAIDEPRVGHHVWNGSAWVDEGLLHESESRTNLFLSSDDLSNASYWSPLSGASTPVATSPIMGANAWTLSGAGYLRQSGLSIAASTTHTVWFRMRLPSSPAAGKLRIRIYDNNSSTFITLANGSTVSDFVYDTSGAVTRDTSSVDFLIDGGNGVYLVGAAFTTLATVTTYLVFIYPDVSSSTQPVDVATPQLEEGPTPSSYIPTSGAAATRAADVLTIPAANLPWPTPEVIGPELVTNGTFDTDISGWADASSAGGSIAWNAAGYLDVINATGTARTYEDVVVESGKVYEISFDVPASTSGSAFFYLGSTSNTENIFSGVAIPAGSYSFKIAAISNLFSIGFRNFSAGTTVSLDNISVREIKPLAVSIQMDGRVTYADEGLFSKPIFAQWQVDTSNRLQIRLDTNSAQVGRFVVNQVSGGATFFLGETGDTYSPDVLVPFNVAGRFGSNFLNGARQGSALTARTDVTSLPDLSAVDLSLGNAFNGTIRTFRIWADDIGDAGLVEATT